MKLYPETREILRHYKSVVNEHRKELGLSAVNTARIIDEICVSMTLQSSVYIAGAFIVQGSREPASVDQ